MLAETPAILAGNTRRVFDAAQTATRMLALEHGPPIYVSDINAPVGAWALGTEDDALIIIHPLWVDALSDSELERYARQIVLPEVGALGQKKLKKSPLTIALEGATFTLSLPAA